MMKRNESNFKRAMNELLSFDPTESREDAAEREGQPDQAPDRQWSPAAEPEEAPEESAPERAAEEHTVPSAGFPFGAALGEPKAEAVITSDVIIEGNVRSGSNLKIYGQIFGNVVCEGQINLAGNVMGDVQSAGLRFSEGRIEGNVMVTGDLSVEKQAGIKGDITAGNVVFNGKEEGNMMVSGSLELREASVVIGNVSAKCVSMYNGARLKGLLDVGEELE